MGACMSITPAEPGNSPSPIFRSETSSGAVRPLIIAHRCGAGLGPENTCGAVVQSSFYRPDYFEIDIRHTSDGVAICLHDPTLNRTTNMEGDPSGMTWEEISGADAGSWFDSTFNNEPIPRLVTVLDCVNPSPLAIEIKEPDITLEECNRINDLLMDRKDNSSVIFSFHEDSLETWREADEGRRTCFLTIQINDQALEGDHEIVGLLHTSCSQEIVNRIHDAGKAVWVWTVDEDFERYMQMEVDGIITNYPDRLRSVIPPS